MRRYLCRYISLALLATAPLFAGCGDDDEELIDLDGGDAALDGAASDVSLASDAADGGAEADAGATADASDASDAIMLLTDLQIVTILHIFNRSEIEQGNLALMRAVATEARTFANAMITAHTAEDAALTALFESPDAEAGADADTLDSALTADGSIPLSESSISKTLLQQSVLQIAELNLKSSTAFDLSYMSGQVANHSEILQLIDDVLTAAAQNPALKMNLAQTRPIEAMHLANAIQTLNTIALAAAAD